jgi:D-3-phosphoglycerate dehydrogenase
MGVKTGFRVCVCHKNVPNVIATLSGLVSAEGVNIDHLASGSRGEYAYTILELNAPISDGAVSKMQAADGVIRVRTIA